MKYPEIPAKLSPDERERQLLHYWTENNIFTRSISERDEAKSYSFYEGPPTVNGVPGIHHVFSRTIKDSICRYKTMQGYRVERKGGWDTHGLPVELAIEKQLGFKHKDEIKEFGVAKFNKTCKDFVFDNIGRDRGWKELTERMAYWADLDNPYITCSNEYIESVWWALKKFWDADKIYKGFKIQPYCPRCETPLSSHEVSLGYDTAKDPSVFVKFKRKNTAEEEFFLAWTTTPWTLISNVALAVHPDVDYVTVINKRKDKTERLVLAEALISKLEGETEIVGRVKGKELEGAEYERLFSYVPVEEKAFYVVLGDYVTVSDGTGIVHTAPAFGEEDFQISRKYNLPLINPVNKSGEYDAIVTDFAGQFVKDADPAITQNLKERGLLYRKETIEHTYPFCWRCDTPLIYYARSSWYIRVTDFKDKLVAANKTINWNPPEIGAGRFGNWLEELKDWGISRERFWGTPFPVWLSEDGTEMKCVGSFSELIGAEFADENGNPTGKYFTQADLANFDPHKPSVDNLLFKENSGNGYLRRVPDVIDVWFDSGSMPFAQHHYMGEGKAGSIPLPPNYPADFINEGIDQTRGWFYTLHAINTFLFGEPAFKNLIVNDLILDKAGLKMSKSRGNVVNPFDVLSQYGTDAVRWYFLESSVPWKPKLFNLDDIAEVERKFFGTLLNTYGFFTLYANIDGFRYSEDKASKVQSRPEMDRWILSKLHSLVASCTQSMDDYDLTKPARAIQEFVIEELSNWYIRRSRRRFWKGELNSDKQAAYETLHECLLTIAKLMAPIAPFMSELLFRSLTNTDNGSVHLADYPVTDQSLIDSALEDRMHKAQIISSLVRQMRERAKIKVRQPLERILVPSANRKAIEELRKVEDIILDEVNVKRVEHIESGDSDVIKRKAKANFKLLGAKLGKQMKTASARIATMSDDEIRTFDEQGFIEFDIDSSKIRIDRGELEIVAEDVEGWLVSSEGGVIVALDTHISDALLNEGLAREFVNRVQNMRKDSGFEVTDRIVIGVARPSATLTSALEIYRGYVQQETLATEIFLSNDALSDREDVHEAELEIGDERALLRLARLN
ncbi:MAG: isoleucine--tRNA ligase [bacterium]